MAEAELEAGPRVNTGAAAEVLGLIKLPVDDALRCDEHDSEEHREEDEVTGPRSRGSSGGGRESRGSRI
jgi:hypothetical protein